LSAGTEAARRALAASLVSGLAHDLNGRLGALLGIAHLARSASPLDEDLLTVLDDQIRRLCESVGLLRTVPLAEARHAPRPMSLADAVTGAVRLYRCRSGPDLATLQVAAEKEGESPVVRIAPAAFTEAMLLAVAAAEQGAGGRTCRVRVTYGTEPGGGGRIRIERLGEGPEPGDAVLEGLTESEVLEAAEERIEDAGGRLARLDDGRFEIFVPSGVGAWAAAGLIPEASSWRG
jgi:signal transduction histidine kinase